MTGERAAGSLCPECGFGWVGEKDGFAYCRACGKEGALLEKGEAVSYEGIWAVVRHAKGDLAILPILTVCDFNRAAEERAESGYAPLHLAPTLGRANELKREVRRYESLRKSDMRAALAGDGDSRAEQESCPGGGPNRSGDVSTVQVRNVAALCREREANGKDEARL